MSGITASPINDILLANGLLIKDNPAISPDLTLNFKKVLAEISAETGVLASVTDVASAQAAIPGLKKITLWPKSFFSTGTAVFFVIESKETGDCALISNSRVIPDFDGAWKAGGLTVIPLVWSNIIRLKNIVQENDPDSTIFPRAADALRKTSLGIGARFTTLHWPAVAWSMKVLGLPLTANQNSIPRELVYDIDAMLNDRLEQVPFPFIGRSVPEGHQGQSVQGMSHASIIEFLKHGFHRNRIPWGFNADHQPIGGRFDAIEKELVAGSLFASYITYDMSPELAACKRLDGDALETAFCATVDQGLFSAVVRRLTDIKCAISGQEIKKTVTYLMPAMKKVKRRDDLYIAIRHEHFTTGAGRQFIKELSIDELPDETTPETLAICLALAEAMGMKFNFVAPALGFQKNIPYPDNTALEKKIARLFSVAQAFGVSIGFHSGSGKSAENYRTIGKMTNSCFEIKTSGRYTYEMGVALSQSNDHEDRKLWNDWHEFTKRIAGDGAFSGNETQRSFARDFIAKSLSLEGIDAAHAFDSQQALTSVLDRLKPSPEHLFWFEYNFLYVLAGGGNTARLGDHSPEGYRQRSRFYRISGQAQLIYAKRVAGYVIFLAESTGMIPVEAAEKARAALASYKHYGELLEAISSAG
jgi:hypothetical protein